MSFIRQDLAHLLERHVDMIGEPCLWFAVQSMQVWDRIAFVQTLNTARKAVRRPGIPITEWSITEKILFDLNQSRAARRARFSGVEMWTAEHEPTEGNDIDLWIQYSFGWVHFMLQAKRLYPRGRYDKLWARNRHGYQVDVLLSASQGHGMPLYLLYNWISGVRREESHCRYECDETQYGCTVVPAARIRSFMPAAAPLTKPTFGDLHPSPPTIAFPWIVLVCCRHNSIESLGKSLGLIEEESRLIPVFGSGPEEGTFTYLPPSVEGENSEPVSYIKYTGEAPLKSRSLPDSIPGRYYAPYLLSISAL